MPGGEQRVACQHRVGLGDLASEELDRERRHLGRHRSARTQATPSASGSARDRRPVVLPDHRPQRCPRPGALGERRELHMGSGSRLRSRGDDIEEQATEGHADRERVRQVGITSLSFGPTARWERMRRRGLSVTVPSSRIGSGGLSIGRGGPAGPPSRTGASETRLSPSPPVTDPTPAHRAPRATADGRASPVPPCPAETRSRPSSR